MVDNGSDPPPLPFRKPERSTLHEVENTDFSFSATLRIFGDSLPLQEITDQLGLQPTHTHLKGERRGPRSPPYRHDMWSVSAQLPETDPLEEHIMWLWEHLNPHFDYLKRLKRAATVDVFCGYTSNVPTAGFEVGHDCLRLFTELEVPFGVSVIVLD